MYFFMKIPLWADMVIYKVGEEVSVRTISGEVIASSRDHSEAVSRAFEVLKDMRGGVMVFRSGEYRLQEIPLYSNIHVVGVGVVKITLPSTHAKCVFRAGDSRVSNVEIHSIKLHGGGSGAIAMSFENAEYTEKIVLDNIYVENFKCGFKDAMSSYDLTIQNSKFTGCEIGVYVKSKHIRVVNSEFSNCSVGLSGSVQGGRVVYSTFMRNKSGVRRFNGGSISNILFYNCSFHDNSDLSVELDEGSLLVNSQITASTSCVRAVIALGKNVIEGNVIGPGDYSDVVIDVVGRDVSISNNIFHDIKVGSAVLRINGENTLVLGNKFHNIQGVVVLLTGRLSYPAITTNHFNDVEGSIISVNYEVRAPLIALNQIRLTREAQVLVHSANAASYFPTILGNSVYVETSQSKPLLHLNLKAPGLMFTGNIFRAMAWKGVTTTILSGDLRGGLIENNVFSDVTVLSDNVLVDENTKIKNNYGYTTEKSGVVLLPANSNRVRVLHGLVKKPVKIMLTPQSNIRVWVENITEKSFDIVAETPPASNIFISWYAEL